MAMALMTHDWSFKCPPNGQDYAGKSYSVWLIRRIQCQPQPQHFNGSNGFVINGNAYDNSGNRSAAGDVNGDGFDDLIIGAKCRPTVNIMLESYVVFGSSEDSVPTSTSNSQRQQWL